MRGRGVDVSKTLFYFHPIWDGGRNPADHCNLSLYQSKGRDSSGSREGTAHKRRRDCVSVRGIRYDYRKYAYDNGMCHHTKRPEDARGHGAGGTKVSFYFNISAKSCSGVVIGWISKCFTR